MAVGCELKIADVHPLKQAMNSYADRHIDEEDLRRKLRIDTMLEVDEIDTAFLDFLSRLSPFGVGNPKPIFATDDVEVVAAPRRLQDRHIKLFLKHNGRYFDAVVTRESTWRIKPHPSPVRLAAEICGVPASCCAMIGDTPPDIKSARSAGAYAVGVLCGFGEREELLRAGAYVILDHTSQLQVFKT